MVDVKFYRPFRALKNGGCISSNMRVGISDNGAVFVPARALGISDGEALGGGAIVILEETVFVDLDQAIRILPNPDIKKCLHVLKMGLLRKCRR